MDPRGRFGRRTLLAGGSALAVLPAVAACSPRKPPPAITRHQVQNIQDAYAHKLFVAMRTRNQNLLRTIEADPLLDRDLATIRLGDRLRAPRAAEEYTLPNSVGYPVTPSVRGDDRQQLITVADYSNTERSWRDLALYVRDGPAGGWRRAYGAGLHASDVPALGHDRPLTALAPDAAGYPASPNTIPAIVCEALTNPWSDQAGMFTDTDVRQRYAATLDSTRRHAAEIGTVTRYYQPGPLVIAIAIADGYLALGSFDYDETLTARRGEHIRFAATSNQHRAYPGRYRRTIAGYGAMFAALVPKNAKIKLISGEQRQTDLKVERI